MKNHWLRGLSTSFLFLLFCACGFRQGIEQVSQAQTPAADLTVAQAQADFDLMRKALEEAHTGLYRFSTKAEMDRMFDAQRAKLSRPLNKTEFLAIVAETLANIRCGHTGATPDSE